MYLSFFVGCSKMGEGASSSSLYFAINPIVNKIMLSFSSSIVSPLLGRKKKEPRNVENFFLKLKHKLIQRKFKIVPSPRQIQNKSLNRFGYHMRFLGLVNREYPKVLLIFIQWSSILFHNLNHQTIDQ